MPAEVPKAPSHPQRDLALDGAVIAIAEDGSLAGAISRSRAHRAPGILHLAVSVQLVDRDGNWLLQRRAASKEGFPRLWANSCCTHPAPGEEPVMAGARRVGEELGLAIEQLIPAGVFTYRAADEHSGLVEYEQDHVFAAVADVRGALPNQTEIGELIQLPYRAALALVKSKLGAPWGAEVLRRSFGALEGTQR